MKQIKIPFPTILHLSLKSIPEIETALNDGLDVNQIESKNGSTLLHYASSGFTTTDKLRWDIHLCEFLLSKGANPNIQDNDGFTPLHYASQNNDVDLATLLLSKGANPNLLDKWGNIPLKRCRFDGKNDTLIKILLDAGSDPQKMNNSNVSALSLSKLVGNIDTIKLVESYIK